MSWFNEAPMTEETIQKLLGTRAAKSRTALAAILAEQPALTYNGCMTALKAAPRGNSQAGWHYLGQQAARRLFGKAGR